MTVSPLPANYITIDGKPYFILTEDKRPNWSQEFVPTQAGDPLAPRWVRFNDWSRGMGDSRGLLRGAVEYAEAAYLGSIGRLLPGPAIGTIATAHSAPITCFVDVTAPASRVLAGGGTKVSEINPSTQAVTTSASFTGPIKSMALFIDQVAIASGASVRFYKRNASGTYSQTADNLYADAFGISGSTLVRGRGAYWSRCELADFMDDANWSAEFDIGDLSGNINQVFEHNRFDYILKDEGLYTYDDAADETANVIEDLRTWKSSENRSFARWNELLFIPSLGGLYRYQGTARPVGIEEVNLNENEMRAAYPTAMAAFGRWAYVAYYDGTSTWICSMRRAQDGDSGMGSPFTLVSVVDKFTGKCLAMHVSSLTSPPTLYYGGASNGVRYFALSRDGVPASYTTGGTTTVRFSPSDLNSPMTVKFFKSIEVYGRNAAAARAIQWQAGIDGGSLNNVGASITSLSNGYAQRFWTQGSNDEGRVIQLVATMTNNSASAPPEIREVQLNFEERPIMTTAFNTALRIEDEDSEGGIIDDRSAILKRSDLEALIDGAVVDVMDPWGETFKARISQLRLDTTQQMRDSYPVSAMPIQIRRLDYS